MPLSSEADDPAAEDQVTTSREPLGAPADADPNPGFTAAPGPMRGERVVVGLSGGVDSAVTTLLLHEAGCEVVTVTTRNFCFDQERFERAAQAGSCCSQEAVDASRELSSDLGLSHVVLDVSEHFERTVIDDYVAEYRAGHTPSPCVRCNTHVRFPQLLAFARKVGATRVATGHYARIVTRGDEHFVARGVDRQKDQSYFLFRLPSDRLAATLMPLGDRTKDEVRELARRHGLPVADAPESQELCFVPDGDRAPLLGAGAMPGEIVDRQGRVLGTHEGVEFYTVGQRRGLGIGGGDPLYVVALDARRRRVVVGSEADLYVDGITLDEVVWRDPWGGAPGLQVRTRYRHRGVDLQSMQFDAAGLPSEILLASADRAPAVGQAAVFYRGEVTVGGGRIAAAHHARPSVVSPIESHADRDDRREGSGS